MENLVPIYFCHVSVLLGCASAYAHVGVCILGGDREHIWMTAKLQIIQIFGLM